MNTIKLRLTDESSKKVAELEMQGVTLDQQMETIFGVMEFMIGRPAVVATAAAPVFTEKAYDATYEQDAPPLLPSAKDVKGATAADLQKAVDLMHKAQTTTSRSHTLPKVNAERTLTTSLGDNPKLTALAAKMQERADNKPATGMQQPEGNDPLITGIQYKIIKGVKTPCYRVGYKCPCGHAGRRYVPEYAKYTPCHQCTTPLEVREAVPGKPLERDAVGNFFVANREYVFPTVGKRN